MACALVPASLACSKSSPQVVWRMPDEGARHTRTWMAFGATEEIWGAELLPEVRRDLATIANTIVQFEPVTVLVRSTDRELAVSLLDPAVNVVNLPLDDLWIRDTGPLFVRNEKGDLACVELNFNGWGGKQEHSRDSKVGTFLADLAGFPKISTSLVLEGGCLEVDGAGTAILTESCSLNSNRNPGLSKSQMETELRSLFGLERVIWLPGVAGKDITDGHTDFYVRFVEPGKVLAALDTDPESFDHEVTKKHLEILRASTDAQGRKLQVDLLEAPFLEDVEPDFAAGYVGYYVCNGAVICQAFGDPEADSKAKETIQAAFPDREVVQIRIDAIAAGGGSVHCATQQEPA